MAAEAAAAVAEAVAAAVASTATNDFTGCGVVAETTVTKAARLPEAKLLLPLAQQRNSAGQPAIAAAAVVAVMVRVVVSIHRVAPAAAVTWQRHPGLGSIN